MDKKIQQTWQQIRHRDGLDTLPQHLEHTYGVRVVNLKQLDGGVYRVDLQNRSAWVARMFPSARPLERAQGDADVLRFLEQQHFPAERLAHAEPLSTHTGQAVLVTQFIEGSRPSDKNEKTFYALGELLGRLHSLPEGTGGAARKGGAIHSFTLGEGGIRDEVADAMSWLAEADVPGEHRSLYDATVEQIARIDYGEHLPQALIHPDSVLQNFIATRSGDLIPIDWTGAGRAPRAHSLAFLLLSAIVESRWNPNAPRVDAAIDGYRAHVQLTDEEFGAIATGMPLHVFVRDCAAFGMGQMTFDEVAGGYSVISRIAGAVAERARRAWQSTGRTAR